jgi:peptide chain release factor 3
MERLRIVISGRNDADIAFPGDIVGIVSPGGVVIGETLHDGPTAQLPPIPAFTPELFARVRAHDVSRQKQLRHGLDALGAEGVVQLFHDGPESPLTDAGAVGALQFDVAAYRLQDEFGAPANFEVLGVGYARPVTVVVADALTGDYGVRIMRRADGDLFAVFDSEFSFGRALQDHPELEHAHVVV